MIEVGIPDMEARQEGPAWVFEGDGHELVFLPGEDLPVGPRVGVRWDGVEVRPAVASFSTWDNDGHARLEFAPEARRRFGLAEIEFDVVGEHQAAFDGVHAMLDATGELPRLDAEDREAYAPSSNRQV